MHWCLSNMYVIIKQFYYISLLSDNGIFFHVRLNGDGKFTKRIIVYLMLAIIWTEINVIILNSWIFSIYCIYEIKMSR